MSKKILILTIIIVFIFTNFAYALKIPPEQLPPHEINKKAVDVISDDEGLQKISYTISSRRLNNNSTTTYRTGEIYVDVGGKTFVVPSSELKKIQPTAEEGTVYHQITITRDDLESFLEREGLDGDAIKKALKEPEKMDIRARIDIYRNGSKIDSLSDLDELEKAKEYGFNDKHIEDMETRFKEGEDEKELSNEPHMGTPVNEEVPEPKGIRPTILRNKSIRDD